MGTLTALAIFSGLSLNLLLEFGLDLWYIVDRKQHHARYLILQSVLLFAATVLVWLVFSVVLNPLALGFLETVIILPLSVIIYGGLEKILVFFNKLEIEKRENDFIPTYSGYVFAASFLTLRLAVTFIESLVLAGGFSLGVLGATFIIKEIDKSSHLEAVPKFLKGSPLLLISLGLLSVITSSAAVVFLISLGIF